MDFGKLTPEELAAVDHSLPPDPPENAVVLSGKPADNPRVYVGAPSWNHPEWMGKVYTQGKKSRDFLPEYVRQFNSIEVNATAYSLPNPEKIAHWRDTASEGFKYCIKFPQTLTHYGSPATKLDRLHEFMERVAPIGDHLGPPILQFAERFGPKWLRDLHQVLEAYTYELPLALEMRHADYFVGDNRVWLDWLQQRGHIAIITDTSGRRDVCHMRLTSRRALIRFNGNNLHETDYTRVKAWASRIAYWLSQGLEEVYFFPHTAPKEFVPELVALFRQELSQATGKPPGAFLSVD